jgi:DNA-binding NarL/FixJ family response regulator
MTIRLLVVEDHDLVREGLRATFEGTEIVVVGEATNGCDAIRMAHAVEPVVMLLDLKLHQSNGFDVLHEIKQARPDLFVLIYSQHDRPDFHRRACALGASGYLTKRVHGSELIAAIRQVSRGSNLWNVHKDATRSNEENTHGNPTPFAQIVRNTPP